MRKKLIGLCTLALLLAACGGLTSNSPSHSGVKIGASRPSHKFVASLTGRQELSRGAPDGVGVAVVALHDAAREICWRLAHLHGVTVATRAEIRRGAAGVTGGVVVDLSNGASRLHHEGCTRPGAPLLAAIARRPDLFYINVDTTRFPAGAVRGQL